MFLMIHNGHESETLTRDTPMYGYPSSPAVYMITHKVSGHFYIGSSKNLSNRLTTHKNRLASGRHKNDNLTACYTSWADFEITYETYNTGDEALDREDELLDLFIGQDLCCNLGTSSRAVWDRGMPDSVRSKISKFHKGRDYGEEFSRMRSDMMRGIPRTEEQKRKLSLSLSGRTRDPDIGRRSGEARRGWQPTDETRRRMSEAKKGKPGNGASLSAMKAAVSRAVIVEGRRFDSMSDAARHYGINSVTVRQRIDSKTARFAEWNFE